MTAFLKRTAALVVAAALLVPGCDLIDPSNVTNPDVTEDNALGIPALGGPWRNGLERQTILVLNEALPLAEIASDNYGNFNNFYLVDDNLDFVNDQHPEVEDLQFDLADLREMALFGLNRVQERDPAITDDQVAEFYFFKGYSHLVAGLYFDSLPAEDGGAPISSAAHLEQAIADVDEALALSENAQRIPSYHLAQARAHYYLGNREAAVAAAQAALDAGGDLYVRYADSDPVNLPDSDIEDAVWERNTTDLQPLPRLDFLDPKYNDYARSNYDTPIPMFKAEEALLIQAEADLAAGDLDAAKAMLQDVLGVIDQRPVDVIVDTDERTDRAPGSRPASADWVVRTGDGPFVDGLILTRADGVEIEVPIVSGTSVTAEEIDALGSVEEALETLYLMRQQVFFAEGLRMVDLGIKLPVHENEALTNPNVTAEDRQGFIPDFLPRTELDAVMLDFEALEATIMWDLNEILVANRTSEAVVPFF